MTRSEVLAEADRLVSVERAAVYGDAAESFARIAALWSTDLGIPLTAHDVARLMILLKLSRGRSSREHMDSWVDIAGYAALAGELAA